MAPANGFPQVGCQPCPAGCASSNNSPGRWNPRRIENGRAWALQSRQDASRQTRKPYSVGAPLQRSATMRIAKEVEPPFRDTGVPPVSRKRLLRLLAESPSSQTTEVLPAKAWII